ncbi:hypothetical protein LCGC14_2134510 [marine sediment metagenome]|uniref:Uncharacterized protein n=1 Tax=marine sediment metagenome TaxID=412755 RepID=A0A0F9GDF2_9ZZZZ
MTHTIHLYENAVRAIEALEERSQENPEEGISALQDLYAFLTEVFEAIGEPTERGGE